MASTAVAVAQDWFVSFGGVLQVFRRRNAGFTVIPPTMVARSRRRCLHKWDNGTILFYGRELNDKNLFITDVPVSVSGTGKGLSVSDFPGFQCQHGNICRRRGCAAFRCRRASRGGAHLQRICPKVAARNLHMLG